MLKKTIEYTDFNGVARKEDFYFNLSKAEILEMELSTAGGFAAYIQRIIDTKDTPTLMAIFKDLILKSYGVKSPDGKRFIKNNELTEEFTQTEAYSKFYVELATNDVASAAFINSIIPADMAKEMVTQLSNNEQATDTSH